ncbi:MAG: glutaredoxin family protein [Alteromonadaceae bacterium]|nr:glutaredoxin family protein [Alteromonadaceae bacterium]
MKYKLYSSEGCHLCEQAFALCQQANIDSQVAVIDIVEDENLVTLYGISIPVLENTETSEKLFWPFSLEQIKINNKTN